MSFRDFANKKSNSYFIIYAWGRVVITKKPSTICIGKGGDSVGKGWDDQGSRYPSCLSLLGEEWVWR